MISYSFKKFNANSLDKQAGYDVSILLLTITLCVLGSVFVMTSSAAHAWQSSNGNSMAIFFSHLQKLGFGLVGMLIFAFFDYRKLEKIAKPALIVAAILLISVLILPQPAGATAKRWFYLPPIRFQPAEFAKFALINYLAVRFAAYHKDPFENNIKKIYQGVLIVAGVFLILVLAEPNLSMCLLMLGVIVTLFFLSGIKLKPLLIISLISIPLFGIVAWLKPYMRTRLTEYMTGIVNPMHTGHQVKQSLIGIGNGGVVGLGLGNSMQKHFFLPEPHKDFIFSIISEELGFFGAVFILILFFVFLLRAWKISRNAPDPFGYFLASGITASIACSFIINIGVTVGLLPATGQPLPFISYGGTSLVMSMCAVGILLNISSQSHRSEMNFASFR